MNKVIQLFEEFQEFHKLSDSMANAIQIALDEMVSNIILYAYKDGASHQLEVKLFSTEEAVEVHFRDDGLPFNPFSASRKKVDTESPLTDRPIGGLGLHLVKSLMDSWEYEYRNGFNYSVLTKNRTNKN